MRELVDDGLFDVCAECKRVPVLESGNKMSEQNILGDSISSLESELEKLQSRLSAQQSLFDSIPVRLKANLDAFKKFVPQIYAVFKDYKPSGTYELFCTENGEPNAVNKKENYFFYPESPFSYCKEQFTSWLDTLNPVSVSLNQEGDPFDQIHFRYKNNMCADAAKLLNKRSIYQKLESIPCMVMFGLGLGYPLAEIYSRFTPVNLMVVEPDPEIFYMSLCVFDYASLLEYIHAEQLGLHFYVHDGSAEWLRTVMVSWVDKYPSINSCKAFYVHYHTPKIDELGKMCVDNLGTIVSQLGFFDDALFGFANGARNMISGVRFFKGGSVLPEKMRHYPAVVVANGPSLDNDIELLKQLENKVVIIACGTAYSALCRYGICADIYVAVERPTAVANALAAIETHKEYMDTTVCIAPDVVHPETLKYFKNKVLYIKANEAMRNWPLVNGVVKTHDELEPIARINPLVANMGIETAAKLGFKKIYLLGVDNGQSINNKESHSKLSMYYDDEGNLKPQYKSMTLNKMGCKWPGNFTDLVETNILFMFAITVAEACISYYTESKKFLTKFYNCSDGAKLAGSEPLHFKDAGLECLNEIDKSAVREQLTTRMSKTVELDETKVKNGLKIEKYNEIIETLIDDWKKKPSSRVDMIKKQQAQFDYLVDYHRHWFDSPFKTIAGTLSSLIDIMNTVMYSYDNENEGLEQCWKLVGYIDAFLRQAKHIYPNSLYYVEGHYSEYWDPNNKVPDNPVI